MVLVGVAMVLVRVFEVDYGEDTYFVEDNDFGLVGRAILIVGGLRYFLTDTGGTISQSESMR